MKIKTSLVVALVVLFVQPSFAIAPKTIAELGTLAASDLKALPDYKLKLGKEVTSKDYAGKNEAELTILRNSIYAQAGFKFSNPWMHSYFSARTWYKPTGFDATKLSAIDHQNAKVIMTYQKEMGYALFEKRQHKAQRSVAAVKSANPKSDAVLAKKVLSMKRCTSHLEGEIKEIYNFGKDGKLSLEYSISQQGGSEYGSEYGGDDAYASEYGSEGLMDGMPKSGTYEGEWRVMEGQVQVKAKGVFEVWNLLMFNADGMSSKLCYRF